MNKHQRQAIFDIIDSEGFDYAFVHYADFTDVASEEFHKIREEYLKAREKLVKFIDYKEGT